MLRELWIELEAVEILEEEVPYPETDRFPSTSRLVGQAFDAHAFV